MHYYLGSVTIYMKKDFSSILGELRYRALITAVGIRLPVWRLVIIRLYRDYRHVVRIVRRGYVEPKCTTIV